MKKIPLLISIIVFLAILGFTRESANRYHWPDCVDNTQASISNSTAVITVDSLSTTLPKGLIGVFDDEGNCYGQTIIQSNFNFAMNIMGDDTITSEKDGFADGDNMNVRFYADFQATVTADDYNGVSVPMTYTTDGVYVIRTISFGAASSADLDSMRAVIADLENDVSNFESLYITTDDLLSERTSERDIAVSNVASLTLSVDSLLLVSDDYRALTDSLAISVATAQADAASLRSVLQSLGDILNQAGIN